MLWELKPNGRLITPPQGHAAVCKQEPKKVCRKPAPSAHEAVPSPLQPRPFCKHLGFEGYEHTLHGKQLQHQELYLDDCPASPLDALQPQKVVNGESRTVILIVHSYAEVHLTEQAETRCKPMPTGYKACKESKARVSVWDDRALHPTDGNSKCPTVVHLAFEQGSYSPVRVICWETGLCACASLEDAASAGPQQHPGTVGPTGTQCSSKTLKSGAEVEKAIRVVSYILSSSYSQSRGARERRKRKEEHEHAE